ncbi:MAG: iron-sulfur cluster insertion protein ErpA [Alphaproteobacteria bacterium]|nr:MAG: iron-sulfur cluster insertion protein ErpA [Alphaproteobacteria bacterium]
MNDSVTLTDNAAKRIAEMRETEKNPALMLRLRVDSGGCSGFSYVFDFDDKKADDDLLFEHNGMALVIDPISLELVKGSRIDYVEEMIGAYFSVKNPNAASGCGCGVSFSI